MCVCMCLYVCLFFSIQATKLGIIEVWQYVSIHVCLFGSNHTVKPRALKLWLNTHDFISILRGFFSNFTLFVCLCKLKVQLSKKKKPNVPSNRILSFFYIN